MPRYTCSEVASSTDVEMVEINLALKNVDVCELVHLFLGCFAFAPYTEQMQINPFLTGLPSRSWPPSVLNVLAGPPSPRLRRDSLRVAAGG